MRNPFRLFVELMEQPVWVSVWAYFLIIINVASLGFWEEPLAKLIFITLMVSAMLMMGLYSRFGFEKILGLAHILWVPLLVYILTQLSAAAGTFKTYLVALSVSIAISLAFDFVDVWKYYLGEKST